MIFQTLLQKISFSKEREEGRENRLNDKEKLYIYILIIITVILYIVYYSLENTIFFYTAQNKLQLKVIIENCKKKKSKMNKEKIIISKNADFQ